VRKTSILFVAFLAVVILASASHRWLALAWNAWRYPEAASADRTQIAIMGRRAYLAAGIDGIEVIWLSARGCRSCHQPPRPTVSMTW
jgi:hypothetical protein